MREKLSALKYSSLSANSRNDIIRCSGTTSAYYITANPKSKLNYNAKILKRSKICEHAKSVLVRKLSIHENKTVVDNPEKNEYINTELKMQIDTKIKQINESMQQHCERIRVK